MPCFLYKSLDSNRLLLPYRHPLYGIFGGIFFANMGGGGGQSYFQKLLGLTIADIHAEMQMFMTSLAMVWTIFAQDRILADWI